MNEKSLDREREQLNNSPAPTGSEQEYSLDEIMREFGGWSDWSQTPALWPEKPQSPKAVPEPPPASQTEPPEPETEQEQAPERPSVPEPEQTPPPDAGEEDVKRVPEESPAEPEKKDVTGDTIRFGKVEAPEEQKGKVWTYKGEPTPDNDEDDENALSPRQALRRAKREERAARREQRRKARAARRQEQPDHVYDSPEQAYQAYAQRSTLRLRLIASALLLLISVVLAVLCNYTFGSFSFTGWIQVPSLGMLVILLLQILLSYDVLVKGILAALRFRFDHFSLLVLLCVVCVADALFALFQARVPFCTVVSLELTLALWGESMHLGAKCRTMKAVCNMPEPVAAVKEEKAWHGKDCIFRADGNRREFVRQIELPDATRRVMRLYAPLLAVLTLVLAVLAALRMKGDFFWAWTAMLAGGYPLGILIAYPRPFSNCAKRLSRRGAALAGWEGARNLSGESGLAIEDADLFPTDNVTLNGMKIYSPRSVGQIVGYATAVVETAGSGLVPLFQEIRSNQNGRRYYVETFRRYEGGGLGAELQGDIVLMGSLAFMKLMRVRIPEGTNLKQAVYLAINSELAAVFALHYKPDASVQTSLHSAARSSGLMPILATRDFMITPQFLKHRYKLPPDRIEFPSVEERAYLSSPDAVRQPKQGALMVRGSFQCFSSAVVGARAMRSATRSTMGVAMLGGVIGSLVMFFLTLLGAVQAVSAWNLLVFSLLWLLPELLLTWQSGGN